MLLQYIAGSLNVFKSILCFPGDAEVDVIEEVATDLSRFISSTDAVASSGMKITAHHRLKKLKLTINHNV